MANSVDPDQMPHYVASDQVYIIWSGSTLFTHVCLSEYSGTIWYLLKASHSQSVRVFDWCSEDWC